MSELRVVEDISSLTSGDAFLREWLEVVPRVRLFYERQAVSTFKIPRADAYLFKGGMLVRGKLENVHNFLREECITDRRLVEDYEEGVLIYSETLPNSLVERGYELSAFDTGSALVYMSIPRQLWMAQNRVEQPKINPDVIKAYPYEFLWICAAHEPLETGPWGLNPHVIADRAKLAQIIHGKDGEPEIQTVKKVVPDAELDRLEALFATEGFNRPFFRLSQASQPLPAPSF